MKVKFLGTGTSHGVPLVGCTCPTCSSTDPHNKRYRSSIWVTKPGCSLVVDTPAEFRLRCLEYCITRIDALLLTHAHADHIAGLDDIRIYNEEQSMDIPLYCDAPTKHEIEERFSYIFRETQLGGGKPRLKITLLEHFKEFKAGGFDIMPVPLLHGELTITGFIIDRKFAYLTDCSAIPEKTYAALSGLEVVVIDALRLTPHPTHFSLEQATAAAGLINAKNTYFTHIAHAIEHVKVEEALSPGIKLAYDGLEILLNQ
ncbi:MAG: MBL fold metallo-hydrolase [Candidatus Goldiibacteriota bacterium]|jgi:phosphoribosyl 1,2-cyclic phosphate phosphodiesterase